MSNASVSKYSKVRINAHLLLRKVISRLLQKIKNKKVISRSLFEIDTCDIVHMLED